MAELTGEEVVKSISAIIRFSFVPSEIVAIYKDTPRQNVPRPYAFVHQITTNFSKGLRDSGEAGFIVDVRVHPELTRTDVHTWGRKMGARMLEAIRYLWISSQRITAYDQEAKIEDGVLHVLSSYRFRVIKTVSGVPMQALQINGIRTSSPEQFVAGEYRVATLVSKDSNTVELDSVIIDGSRVNMSLLTQDTALWSAIQPGDSLVLLKSGDNYIVIDTLNRDRLKASVDGGQF